MLDGRTRNLCPAFHGSDSISNLPRHSSIQSLVSLPPSSNLYVMGSERDEGVFRLKGAKGVVGTTNTFPSPQRCDAAAAAAAAASHLAARAGDWAENTQEGRSLVAGSQKSKRSENILHLMPCSHVRRPYRRLPSGLPRRRWRIMPCSPVPPSLLPPP